MMSLGEELAVHEARASKLVDAWTRTRIYACVEKRIAHQLSVRVLIQLMRDVAVVVSDQTGDA